ncbi:MAG: PP2C family protein-serine/threonine phosphatase, partial [Acidimicrobiia bacterium]|nr:PP2C family protein-serine/threonine phosphatase [Acidimicrobiia bacterium]
TAAADGARPARGRLLPAAEGTAPAADRRGWLEQPLTWVTFLDFTDWDTGGRGTLAAAIGMSPAEVYRRISATPVQIGSFTFGQVLLILLALVGGLFLVIEAVAFVTGLGLARSITGSLHELFVGTARIRHGDFSYKIPIRTRDQLGQLAESFNEMTASIDSLLAEKAAKDRLEEELRIARTIQMSLLPQGPLDVPGLTCAAHCEPAREVGGDYYDVLPLDGGRVGLLVADVSGKGTSAAFYMAELKGLMLALAARHTSPRALLIDANRLLSPHIDARSFITITYAVIDPAAGTLTHARAGHCPLIHLPGPDAAERRARLVAPDGMVMGLKLDHGEMFERVLEEHTVQLGAGDVVMLFTDGLSEAMNPAMECFGEARLAELLERGRDLPFDALRGHVLGGVRAFAAGAAPHDDMTLLLVAMNGAAPTGVRS